MSNVKDLVKPCRLIRFCPYGPLVKQFPLLEEPDEMSCAIFSHQCPIYYVVGPFCDGDYPSGEELVKMYKALEEAWGKRM
jgi:hypothetical protein